MQLKLRMVIKMKIKICCLCKEKYEGYGNNADPLSIGKCCDKCNADVIIERIKLSKQDKW